MGAGAEEDEAAIEWGELLGMSVGKPMWSSRGDLSGGSLSPEVPAVLAEGWKEANIRMGLLGRQRASVGRKL